jgi:Cysteine-rich secretory protein family
VSIGQSAAAAGAITDMWYNSEVNAFLPSYYGESTPDTSNFDAWGHFSQIVWAGSTTIGCASVFCPSPAIFNGFDAWFTVCNYGPAGKIILKF